MQRVLNQAFNTSCFSSIEFFQLRDVDLPNEFEEAIQQTEISKQNISKSFAQYNASLITMETELLQAQFAANVTRNVAEGEANATIIQATASADSFKLVQQTQAEAYRSIKEELAMNNQELIEFLKARVIRDHGDGNLVVAVSGFKTNDEL